jgi:hypothetical protein
MVAAGWWWWEAYDKFTWKLIVEVAVQGRSRLLAARAMDGWGESQDLDI